MGYSGLHELVVMAEREGCKISKVVKKLEAEELETTEEELFSKMAKMFSVMKESMENGLNKELRSTSGLTGAEGRIYWQHISQSLCGKWIAKAIARAMAVANVNASMGKIVAAPTAGAGGILPAVVLTIGEKVARSDNEIVDSLFTAAGVGKVIALRASLSGAEGGCQAECGSAAAMAAAAAVELADGKPFQVENAVAFALKSTMGLVCDPVAGLVEVPCVKRNGILAAMAISAADLALAGIRSVIPADEVIDAMKSVGDMLPLELKETAAGGIAITPAAKQVEDSLK